MQNLVSLVFSALKRKQRCARGTFAPSKILKGESAIHCTLVKNWLGFFYEHDVAPLDGDTKIVPLGNVLVPSTKTLAT